MCKSDFLKVGEGKETNSFFQGTVETCCSKLYINSKKVCITFTWKNSRDCSYVAVFPLLSTIRGFRCLVFLRSVCSVLPPFSREHNSTKTTFNLKDRKSLSIDSFRVLSDAMGHRISGSVKCVSPTVKVLGVFLLTGFLASQNYYLNLNFRMQRDYDILILEDQFSPHFLEQGFIECIVSQTVRPFKTRHFFHCVHCGKLRSSSWFFDHRKSDEFDLSPKSIQKYRSCFFHFVSDIHSEVDYLFEKGTLFE